MIGNQKIESSADTAYKRRWKIVDLSTGLDVPGDDIISADEMTGECSMSVKGDLLSQQHNFGPGGMRIVSRRR